MKRFSFALLSSSLAILVLLLVVFAGCGVVTDGDDFEDCDDEATEEVEQCLAASGESYGGEWSRVATYTDGVDMGTGAAWLNFLGDGTFVSTTSLCTATGDYAILPLEGDEADEELGDMVFDAGRMSMSYVQSDCPGFTLSALTYGYEIAIEEDGGETMTLNAEYAGHLVTEVYVR
jgi:hypothetical protein